MGAGAPAAAAAVSVVVSITATEDALVATLSVLTLADTVSGGPTSQPASEPLAQGSSGADANQQPDSNNGENKQEDKKEGEAKDDEQVPEHKEDEAESDAVEDEHDEDEEEDQENEGEDVSYVDTIMAGLKAFSLADLNAQLFDLTADDIVHGIGEKHVQDALKAYMRGNNLLLSLAEERVQLLQLLGLPASSNKVGENHAEDELELRPAGIRSGSKRPDVIASQPGLDSRQCVFLELKIAWEWPARRMWAHSNTPGFKGKPKNFDTRHEMETHLRKIISKQLDQQVDCAEKITKRTVYVHLIRGVAIKSHPTSRKLQSMTFEYQGTQIIEEEADGEYVP